MTFEVLWDAAQRGELLLVRGGMCHYHLRRDGQVTIREIVVLPDYQRKCIGTSLLRVLQRIPGASSIFAKCPVDLDANGWYECMGFALEGQRITKNGRRLILWRLLL